MYGLSYTGIYASDSTLLKGLSHLGNWICEKAHLLIKKHKILVFVIYCKCKVSLCEKKAKLKSTFNQCDQTYNGGWLLAIIHGMNIALHYCFFIVNRIIH